MTRYYTDNYHTYTDKSLFSKSKEFIQLQLRSSLISNLSGLVGTMIILIGVLK